MPRRRPRQLPGPVPTLGQLQAGSSKWVWAICEGMSRKGEPCMHRAPLALAPFVIRWSADASSDVMRQRLRCAVCGHRGACLQHPSWMGTDIGFQPFLAAWAAVVAVSCSCHSPDWERARWNRRER
jgi:hypothetical protein